MSQVAFIHELFREDMLNFSRVIMDTRWKLCRCTLFPGSVSISSTYVNTLLLVLKGKSYQRTGVFFFIHVVLI